MIIGILISPLSELTTSPIRKQLPEPTYYEHLSKIGIRLGMIVYVFRATDYNRHSSKLTGYVYQEGIWRINDVPLPDIVIDRTFHTTKQIYQRHVIAIQYLEQQHHYIYFNANLPNKLHVYDQLRCHLPMFIPPSTQYERFSELEKAIDDYREGIILKPMSGMQGKGIIHIKKEHGLYSIKGRQLNNRSFCTTLSTPFALQRWILFFRKNHPYLFQPFYKFLTADDEPFDIRVLMQKNNTGRWQLTGAKARVGLPQTLTSNLHGGGSSKDIIPLLSLIFPADEVAHLQAKIHMISWQIVEHLEASFGRFGELALDFGIDDKGNIILLECNSKPGRQAFLSDPIYAEDVILHPLHYAQFLQRHYGQSKRLVHHNKSTSILIQEVNNESHSL